MKSVAITGGAQGIGRGLAAAFAADGYRVSILDGHAAAGSETLELLAAEVHAALLHVGSVAEPADVEAWLDATEAAFGDIPDLLINNAGIMANAPMLELDVEDFDRVLGVNLRGTFVSSQRFARRWVDSGKPGCIINLASTRARMSEAGTEAYSASKGGIRALTHAMAVSLGPRRIRVNSVSPGWIETRDWQFGAQGIPIEHSEADRLQHPVGRVGSPDDIAQACRYLADAGFVTGQDLVVDGGMTVKMIYED